MMSRTHGGLFSKIDDEASKKPHSRNPLFTSVCMAPFHSSRCSHAFVCGAAGTESRSACFIASTPSLQISHAINGANTYPKSDGGRDPTHTRCFPRQAAKIRSRENLPRPVWESRNARRERNRSQWPSWQHHDPDAAVNQGRWWMNVSQALNSPYCLRFSAIAGILANIE